MKSSEVMRAVAKQVAGIDTSNAYLCCMIDRLADNSGQASKLRATVSKAINGHTTFLTYMEYSLGIKSAYSYPANEAGKQRFINFMRSKLAERIADEFEAKGD